MQFEGLIPKQSSKRSDMEKVMHPEYFIQTEKVVLERNLKEDWRCNGRVPNTLTITGTSLPKVVWGGQCKAVRTARRVLYNQLLHFSHELKRH